MIYYLKQYKNRIQNNREVITFTITNPVKKQILSTSVTLYFCFETLTLVWFGLTWSLELYQQTNARLWRQGQKETVVIHHLIAKGTIDERVMKALNDKNNTQSALIDAVKATLKEV